MTKLKLDAFGVAKSLGQAQKHPNSPKMNKDKMQISGISQQLLCGLSLLLQNTRQLFMAEILTTPANIENNAKWCQGKSKIISINQKRETRFELATNSLEGCDSTS
jgi:hypothetical protein